LHEQTHHYEPPLTETIDEAAADGGEHEQRRRPWQQSHASAEGTDTLSSLEELRKEEHDAVHRGIEEKAGCGACREGGHGKEAQGHHGFSGAHFPGGEADAESDADQQ
jgi:hypothetical protein